jgi:hypothetical protein
MGMALMQPAAYVCEMEVVQWVYAHTERGSRLRGYVVALWCQRGGKITPEMWAKGHRIRGFWADVVAYMRVLEVVRRRNAAVLRRDRGEERIPVEFLARGGEGGLRG